MEMHGIIVGNLLTAAVSTTLSSGFLLKIISIFCDI